MSISAEAGCDDQASSRCCGLSHQHAEKKPQKTKKKKEARPPRDVSPDVDVIVDDGDVIVVPETPPPRRRGKSLTLTILMKAAPGYRRLQISQ